MGRRESRVGDTFRLACFDFFSSVILGGRASEKKNRSRKRPAEKCFSRCSTFIIILCSSSWKRQWRLVNFFLFSDYYVTPLMHCFSTPVDPMRPLHSFPSYCILLIILISLKKKWEKTSAKLSYTSDASDESAENLTP